MPIRGRLRSIPAGVYEWPGSTEPAKRGDGTVTLDELRSEVADGAIDTVMLVMTDMQGRLMGNRVQGHLFMWDIADHGAEGCYCMIAIDDDRIPLQGFVILALYSGHSDFVLA